MATCAVDCHRELEAKIGRIRNALKEKDAMIADKWMGHDGFTKDLKLTRLSVAGRLLTLAMCIKRKKNIPSDVLRHIASFLPSSKGLRSDVVPHIARSWWNNDFSCCIKCSIFACTMEITMNNVTECSHTPNDFIPLPEMPVTVCEGFPVSDAVVRVGQGSYGYCQRWYSWVLRKDRHGRLVPYFRLTETIWYT